MFNESRRGDFQLLAILNHLEVNRMGHTSWCPYASISVTFSAGIDISESKGRCTENTERCRPSALHREQPGVWVLIFTPGDTPALKNRAPAHAATIPRLASRPDQSPRPRRLQSLVAAFHDVMKIEF